MATNKIIIKLWWFLGNISNSKFTHLTNRFFNFIAVSNFCEKLTQTLWRDVLDSIFIINTNACFRYSISTYVCSKDMK